MPRRLLLLLLPVIGTTAVVASASGGGASGDARAVESSRSLRLPDLDRCVVRGRVRVTVVPPAGTSFASLAVRAGGVEVLQLAGLTGPGSVVVRIPRRGARVFVSATTSDGRFLDASRRYTRCPPPRAVPPAAAPREEPRPRRRARDRGISGGGED